MRPDLALVANLPGVLRLEPVEFEPETALPLVLEAVDRALADPAARYRIEAHPRPPARP